MGRSEFSTNQMFGFGHTTYELFNRYPHGVSCQVNIR